MADLLSSLRLPNSSQESFHSVASQASELPNNNVIPKGKTANIYDVDAFLENSNNTNTLNEKSNLPREKKASAAQTAHPSEPVSLGSSTNHHVPALMKLCQSKGLKPDFNIFGDASNASFGGTLMIEGVKIESEGFYHSKKEAKEALARKGVNAIQNMKPSKSVDADVDTDKNWVGKLQEYHSSVDPSTGPEYKFFGLEMRFGCTCTTPHVPDRSFGSSTPTFPNKKLARIAAAKQAIEHLISADKLNSDGSTKSRKKASSGSGATVRMGSTGILVNSSATYGQKVQELCPILGLTSPQYVMSPTNPNAPSLYSGYAVFPSSPEMPERIGEIHNIYGKKNAREEMAKGVWESLLKLGEERGVKFDNQ